ncbi:hypothetical protein GQ53DRAFT_450189 [Thozetella sp. PMI_491]|nr:hypothetical protein GQ53DRAFT_450189 [Thozetella sp. PMI_491]
MARLESCDTGPTQQRKVKRGGWDNKCALMLTRYRARPCRDKCHNTLGCVRCTSDNIVSLHHTSLDPAPIAKSITLRRRLFFPVAERTSELVAHPYAKPLSGTASVLGDRPIGLRKVWPAGCAGLPGSLHCCAIRRPGPMTAIRFGRVVET